MSLCFFCSVTGLFLHFLYVTHLYHGPASAGATCRAMVISLTLCFSSKPDTPSSTLLRTCSVGMNNVVINAPIKVFLQRRRRIGDPTFAESSTTHIHVLAMLCLLSDRCSSFLLF